MEAMVSHVSPTAPPPMLHDEGPDVDFGVALQATAMYEALGDLATVPHALPAGELRPGEALDCSIGCYRAGTGLDHPSRATAAHETSTSAAT